MLCAAPENHPQGDSWHKRCWHGMERQHAISTACLSMSGAPFTAATMTSVCYLTGRELLDKGSVYGDT